MGTLLYYSINRIGCPFCSLVIQSQSHQILNIGTGFTGNQSSPPPDKCNSDKDEYLEFTGGTGVLEVLEVLGYWRYWRYWGTGGTGGTGVLEVLEVLGY